MKIQPFSFLLITLLCVVSCSKDDDPTQLPPPPPPDESIIESFTFSSNGVDTKGKIFLPSLDAINSNLPAIYLIDFKEQHFIVATDEFDQVINGVQSTLNIDALVVTLHEHLDIDAKWTDFQDYYDVFRDMAAYVDSNYTDNTSRTFIGRGSEAGVVLMTILEEDPETSIFDNFIATDSPPSFNSFVNARFQNDDFPENISDKKLHFSFSSTNDNASCTALINVVNDKQYPWLTFESQKYDGIYEDVYRSSFAAGIRFVFNQ